MSIFKPKGMSLSYSLQDILYYLSLDQTHWLLTVGLIVVFAALERFFPRIKAGSQKSRIAVIFSIGILAYATIWAFKNTVYIEVISFFLNFQIYSISKAPIPIIAVFIISILLIDFMVYAFHLLSHKVSILWKLHSIHHADEHVDAKTGVLHHPIETITSLLFILFFAVVLGIPLIALILYAGMATLHNIFSHANIRLPISIDRVLRLIMVTPDMHRTHHSIDSREGNSNFGQIFSVWDRLFGTYVDQPAVGEDNLVMGLEGSEKPIGFSLLNLLLHPFQGSSRNR